MKGLSLLLVPAVTLAWVCPATAQPTTEIAYPAAGIPRPDIAASIGWLNVNKSELSDYDDWYNRSAQAALTVGWYWSTHVKTELEVSASTEADLYVARDDFINGSRLFVASEYGFATRRISLSGQYQFGENAWFHPHLAAGIDANRETVRRLDRDVYVYDPSARTPGLVRRAAAYPAIADTHVRPLLGAGFKAYLTQKGFVRSDLRVVFGKRVEEAMVRFGIGVDF